MLIFPAMAQTATDGTRRRRIITGTILWTLAVILTLASAVYQRLTGPSHPMRVSTEIAGQTVKAKLVRNATTDADAIVSIPDPGGDVTGILHYKRYKTDDLFTAVPMAVEGNRLTGKLPAQPMAGKLEYHIELIDEPVHVMVPPDRNTVIRFKGPVPAWAMHPHIFIMFVAMLFAMRLMLEAILGLPGIRWMTWATFFTTLAGGMILGPVVQYYAFGDAWTGVPFGWDLTDNKTLLAFIFWIIAVIAVSTKGRLRRRGRALALLAAIVMTAIFLIPHSMFGSELDYSKVDSGVPAEEAIGQG